MDKETLIGKVNGCIHLELKKAVKDMMTEIRSYEGTGDSLEALLEVNPDQMSEMIFSQLKKYTPDKIDYLISVFEMYALEEEE